MMKGKGKIIAIVVLLLVAAVIIYYMVTKKASATNGTGGNTGTGGTGGSTSKWGGATATRKPGYVSGAPVDPNNLLSTDTADLIPNPAWVTWKATYDQMEKESRFGGPPPPPKPPTWIYR